MSSSKIAKKYHPWLYINYASKEQDPFQDMEKRIYGDLKVSRTVLILTVYLHPRDCTEVISNYCELPKTYAVPIEC